MWSLLDILHVSWKDFLYTTLHRYHFLVLAWLVGLAPVAFILPWSCPPGIYYRIPWSCLLWGHLTRVCIWSFLLLMLSNVQLDILLSLDQKTPESFDYHCGHCLWRWTGSLEEKKGKVVKTFDKLHFSITHVHHSCTHLSIHSHTHTVAKLASSFSKPVRAPRDRMHARASTLQAACMQTWHLCLLWQGKGCFKPSSTSKWIQADSCAGGTQFIVQEIHLTFPLKFPAAVLKLSNFPS